MFAKNKAGNELSMLCDRYLGDQHGYEQEFCALFADADYLSLRSNPDCGRGFIAPHAGDIKGLQDIWHINQR